MKVKFLKNWLGPYAIGDVASLDKDLAKGLIAKGVAEPVSKPAKTATPPKEKAKKK